MICSISAGGGWCRRHRGLLVRRCRLLSRGRLLGRRRRCRRRGRCRSRGRRSCRRWCRGRGRRAAGTGWQAHFRAWVQRGVGRGVVELEQLVELELGGVGNAQPVVPGHRLVAVGARRASSAAARTAGVPEDSLPLPPPPSLSLLLSTAKPAGAATSSGRQIVLPGVDRRLGGRLVDVEQGVERGPAAVGDAQPVVAGGGRVLVGAVRCRAQRLRARRPRRRPRCSRRLGCPHRRRCRRRRWGRRRRRDRGRR